MSELGRISLGLPGVTRPAVVEAVARRLEQAGFRGLWLNDTPDGDSLAGLRVAAAVTSRLQLGTGVIPVDRRSPAEIAAAAADLPADRLALGIGSGQAREGLALVERALADLREATAASLYLGALGPRMRQLGARVADGLLLSWLTPAAAADAMDDLRRDAGGRPVRGVLYARTAVEAAALPALRAEAARYGGYASYAANLRRIGAEAIETTIHPTGLHGRVESYCESVDELVLRAITVDSDASSILRFIDAVVAAG